MRMNDKDIRNQILDSWEWLKDANEDFIYDRLTEMADSAVPVYNNEIIQDWQEMPSEFDDAGQEFGIDADATIIQRMMLDLFAYYQDAYRRVYADVLAEEARLTEEDAN